jgi:hypothetical protein
VICNPRGYRGYETQANIFDPTVGFEIWARKVDLGGSIV